MTELFSSFELAMESAKQTSEIQEKQIFIYIPPKPEPGTLGNIPWIVMSDHYSSKPFRPSHQFVNGRLL